jgi:hypothetical protein
MTQSVTGLLAADAFMPPVAPVVLLLFLGAGFLVFCGAVGGAIAAAARRLRLARVLGGAALTVAVVYGVLLLAASLLSRERTLAAGEKKYFCEMDCHLGYSVETVSAPDDSRRIVTLRTWFDPSTIAAFRGDRPLTPNPRVVYLVDSAGRRYPPSGSPAPVEGPPLTRELRPGESYLSTFAFAVPARTGPLRLFLGDPPGLESFIINHENSAFHARSYFALPLGNTAAAGRRS